MFKSKTYQIAGSHYMGTALQPWDIIDRNGLDYYKGNALKYLLRRKPGIGRDQDLLKSLHCIEKYLEGSDPAIPESLACCAITIADAFGLNAEERERDTLRRFEEEECHRILEKIYKTTEHTEKTEKDRDDCQKHTTTLEGSDSSTHPKVKESSPSVSSVYSVVKNTSFDKAWLADETDVERYLESMRKALLDEIRQGKRVQI